MHPSDSRPVVLFVDETTWRCFDQLAAYLRRSGASPVRVTLTPVTGWFRRLVDRSLYDERVVIDDAAGRLRLDELLESGTVVDVQASERAIALLGPDTPLVARLAACALGARVMGAGVVDKCAVSQRLAARGGRVPDQLAAGEVDVDQAIDALSLPLVVKQRVGTAGLGVRVASSRAEVVDALAVLGTGGTKVCFERFVDGEVVHYSGVFGRDGPRHETTMRPGRSPDNPLGPAIAVTSIDDAELRRAGRDLVASLGAEGLVAVEFVRDANGRSWPIDVGTRMWGNALAPPAIGLDRLACYAALIGLAPVRSRLRPARPGATHLVHPRAFLHAVATGRPGEVATAGWELTWGYGRVLGLRYVAIIWFEALAGWRERLRTRRLARPG